MSKLRLVVLGMMGRSPFGGQSWLSLNWLRALSRLGHDVWYVEDDSVWPYDPVQNTVTDDCSYAVAHLERCLGRIGLADRWAFRLADREGACWGLRPGELDELYRSCDALLNVVGATYLWRRHHECEKFISLPSRTSQPFELAMMPDDPEDRRRLERHGLRLVSPFEMSLDVFGGYPAYFRRSRGEFTVAKDQNVRL